MKYTSIALQKSAKRKLAKETKSLNITSLLDIMTILLVFMIKNVSMDVSQRNAPEGMKLPLSVTKDELMKKGQIISIKIYPDKVLYGTENYKVGSPVELMSNRKLQDTLVRYLKKEAKYMKDSGNKPSLLIQADRNVKSKYISSIIKISTRASFANIYFSTIKADNKTQLIDS